VGGKVLRIDLHQTAEQLEQLFFPIIDQLKYALNVHDGTSDFSFIIAQQGKMATVIYFSPQALPLPK